jgi:hypothetical protein
LICEDGREEEERTNERERDTEWESGKVGSLLRWAGLVDGDARLWSGWPSPICAGMTTMGMAEWATWTGLAMERLCLLSPTMLIPQQLCGGFARETSTYVLTPTALYHCPALSIPDNLNTDRAGSAHQGQRHHRLHHHHHGDDPWRYKNIKARQCISPSSHRGQHPSRGPTLPLSFCPASTPQSRPTAMGSTLATERRATRRSESVFRSGSFVSFFLSVSSPSLLCVCLFPDWFFPGYLR